MHVKRLLTAAVAIPVLFGAIYLGGWTFALFVAGFAVGCLWEYYRVVFSDAERRSARSVIGLGYLAGAGIMVAAHWHGF
jgi:phosphatidate cytidylyltransferase